MSSFRKVEKRRVCSAASSPAEIWTMLFHASRKLSPGGQGIGYRKKIEPVFTLSLVEKLLCRVRSSGTAPLAWHHSSGAPLHESNKAGPSEREWCTCYFCGQAVLQSSIEDEEGHVVTTCASRLVAWIHPGKEARVGGPY